MRADGGGRIRSGRSAWPDLVLYVVLTDITSDLYSYDVVETTRRETSGS